MTVTTPIQETETKWEVYENWEVMMLRGAKKRTEGNINLRKKELINFKEQAVVIANHYTALETDSHLLRIED
jgi:1-acyl-sn-glycerol-3-phosphate acyltransferase